MSTTTKLAPREFPVLLYPEDGKWVGESLLTGTISVRDTNSEALEEVMRLLTGEIQDALDAGDRQLDSIILDEPRYELFRLFFAAVQREQAKYIRCQAQGYRCGFTIQHRQLEAVG